ncbi:MAG TPA: hypothetical protein DCM64_01560 [Gammaproteobacteria bacterium]|jgi:hypothetical protein|nr:hypothetical protein [Gammaproteobacteria bacterium]|tara:strand:- start:1582 stop:2103 length:522 start_codon:yes stop_codon:yes gene_type:complete
MCTQFLDSGEYCEKCAGAIETETFVAVESNKMNKPKDDFGQIMSQEGDLGSAAGGKGKDRVIIGVAVAASVGMIFFSLLLYAYPRIFEFDTEAVAAREAAHALEDCLYLFQEIGMILEENELPDESLRCTESSVPNLISQNGNEVRVSHPNPQFHGYSQIYVTNYEHEPILVQ